MTISSRKGSGRPRKNPRTQEQVPTGAVSYTSLLQGSPPPDAIRAAWNLLDEEMRQYLEILSVYWAPVGSETVEDCVRVLQKQNAPGLRLHACDTAKLERRAVEAGLVHKDGWQVECLPALAGIATASAAAAGRLGTLSECARGLTELVPASRRGAHWRGLAALTMRDRVGVVADARLALFEHDWSRLAQHVDLSGPRGAGRPPEESTLWLLFCRPFAAERLAPIPRSLRIGIGQDLVQLATQAFAPAAGLLKWIESEAYGQREAELDALRLAAARRLMLDGELARARRLLGDASPGAARSAGEAVLAFLEGDLPLAVDLFAASSTDRGPTVESTLEFVVYVVARVRTEKSDAVLRDLREMLRSQQESCKDIALLVDIVELRLGQAPSSERAFIANASSAARIPPLATLLADLLDLWQGKSWTFSDIQLVRGHRARVEKAGMRTLVREYDLLLALLTGEDLASRGVRGFIDTIPVAERWMGVLDQLEKVTRDLGHLREEPERLVWILEPDGAHSEKVTVTSKLQRSRKGGGWRTVREASDSLLIELLRRDSPALSAADRKIVEGVIHEARTSGDRSKVVPYLVGHPLVFWAGSKGPLDVVAARPAIRLVERDGRLQMTFEPEAPVSAITYRVIPDGGTLRIVEFTHAERRLAAALQAGVIVPPEGRERLMGIVSALTGQVAVHSDVLLGHLEREEAESTLRLQMLPEGAGLAVQARVRPLGEAGPALVPGRGAASMVRMCEDGGQVQVVRNLVAERRHLDELPARCPALAAAEGQSDLGRWKLADPAQCLAFLEEVEGMEDVILEWSHGQRLAVRRGRFTGTIVASTHADWFAVEADFAVDDGRVLTLRQLLDLVEHASGSFVPLGDDAYLALTDEFRRRLVDLAGFSERSGRGVRFHGLAAAAVEDSLSTLVPLSGETRPWCDWVKRLEAPVEVDVPRGLEVELRDYQVEGFRWLARLAAMGLGACLADDMGLGKTLQAMAILLHRAAGGAALVVAPTSVCGNWLDEARRFAPALDMRLYAGEGRGRELDGLGPCCIVVTSYSLLQQDIETLAAIPWHSVVLDEAQAIKNHQTQRAKAALALQAGFRLATTGTPVENHLVELWSLFEFLNPGLLGPRARFVERFVTLAERDGDRAARSRLKRLVAPFILRRTKAMVLDELPPRTDITHHVDLSDDERALYEALRQRAVEGLDGLGVQSGDGRIRVLAELMRLRRACCHPRLVLPDSAIPSSRLKALAEIVDELRENRHRALVFSQFVDHLALVREHLDARGIPYEYLDGSTPMAERARRVEAFQAGMGDLFLISLRAGGTGLNLTAADYVIHLDPWWNPAVEDQASDRVHRIGQLRPVTVYRLVARGTVEEKIVDLHRHKRELADSLLDGTEAAAQLTGEDLLRLLRD